jgi:hypothetical protein
MAHEQLDSSRQDSDAWEKVTVGVDFPTGEPAIA